MKAFSHPIPNTFGVAATAACYLEYASEEELLQLIGEGHLSSPLLHIGAGSNLLFVNGRYEGTVLHSRIKGVEVTDEADGRVVVRVGAGEQWDSFVALCVDRGWYGVENLSLIPGEVGAAAVQNIGAYGVEVKDVVHSVETIDTRGKRRVYSCAECAYAYRDSLFKRSWMEDTFVTRVLFQLSKRPVFRLDYAALSQQLDPTVPPTLEQVRQTVVRIRQSKLPAPETLGNAGSFFKNPIIERERFNGLQVVHPDMPHYEVDEHSVKIPAGWLIEQAGWKGRSLGKAAVYHRQALVLVNRGGATGRDVVALAEEVQKAVRQEFGIDITPEVNYIY